MNFTLPEAALLRLNAQLNLTGTFNHTVQSAYGGHQVIFKLRVERAPEHTEVAIHMGGQVHSITVRTADPQRHLLVADLIDAIANGRVDSAEPAPARVTRQPVLIEGDELLSTDQLARVRYLVRHGGVTALELGHEQPIQLAVHRRRPGPGVEVILSIGVSRPRTVFLSVRATEADCVKRLLVAIEQMHIIATPRTAAAA